ncbi:GTP-binding protein TypA/BipA [Shewanella sp. HN-41]|nr:GTP-binding protein TypA/BipA [Shewanella sp. HN-41]
MFKNNPVRQGRSGVEWHAFLWRLKLDCYNEYCNIPIFV